MENLTVKGEQEFMGKDIPIVFGGFGKGKKCVSDKTVAEIHSIPVTEVRKTIGRNIERFKENIDFLDFGQRSNEITTLDFLKTLGYAKQSITQAQHIYILSERGYAKLIKIMDTDLAWEIHDKLMDEYFAMRENRVQVSFKEQVECVGVVADILRVNDASKIMMIGELYKSYDLPTAFLPKYEYNGSRELKSATDLLKRFELGMSARNFNVLLREQGYLEERTRKSTNSPSGVKKYNALTEKGLQYGENAVSPQCQREVQPMYYADSFKELFDKVVYQEVA